MSGSGGTTSSSNTAPSSSSSSTSQTPCSDGSQPDSNGNCPPAVPPSNTQTTSSSCPDGFKLNDTDGKCITKNSSTSPTTTTTTATKTQMKTGNAAAGTGTTTTTTTTPSSTAMQTENNGGGNTGNQCKGLSQIDPTSGTCVSESPFTATSVQTGNAGTTTTTTPMQEGNNGSTTRSTAQNGFDLQLPNKDGTCQTGYHKFPGSTNVCVKDVVTSTPSSSVGGTGGTNATSSMPKQAGVTPLQSGSCPYGSSPHPTLGSFSNAGQPGTGSVLCLSTQNAGTAPSAPTGFHIDANGSLIQMEVVQVEPAVTLRNVLAILADNNGNCRRVGFTHVQGTNPTFCFESSALEGISEVQPEIQV
jgi:hypothetical protein